MARERDIRFYALMVKTVAACPKEEVVRAALRIAAKRLGYGPDRVETDIRRMVRHQPCSVCRAPRFNCICPEIELLEKDPEQGTAPPHKER